MNLSFLAGMVVSAIAIYAHREYQEVKNAEVIEYRMQPLEHEVIWTEMLEIIKENVTAISYETWLKPVKPVCIDEKEKVLYVDAYNEFICNTLNARYQNLLNETAEKLMGEGYKVTVLHNTNML